jgi:hypothetical protein
MASQPGSLAAVGVDVSRSRRGGGVVGRTRRLVMFWLAVAATIIVARALSEIVPL